MASLLLLRELGTRATNRISRAKAKRRGLDLPFISDPILDPHIRTVVVARKKR